MADRPPRLSELLHIEAQHGSLVGVLQKRFRFTRREAEVAILIIARHGNAEIAEQLHISTHTARHHVQKVLQKVGANSRRLARQRMLSEDI